MNTPLPNWTLEEVETTLLRLVRGSDQVMVRHLCRSLRKELKSLTREETLVEVMAVVAAALQSVQPSRPAPASYPGEAPMA